MGNSLTVCTSAGGRDGWGTPMDSVDAQGVMDAGDPNYDSTEVSCLSLGGFHSLIQSGMWLPTRQKIENNPFDSLAIVISARLHEDSGTSLRDECALAQVPMKTPETAQSTLFVVMLCISNAPSCVHMNHPIFFQVCFLNSWDL